MWEMAQSSITLFFRGKLFADPPKVDRQLADRHRGDSGAADRPGQGGRAAVAGRARGRH